MISQPKGLVAFTSASGAAHYMFGPAYGVAKAGTDKMAADMAVDSKTKTLRRFRFGWAHY
jgi:hypothetical protein